MIWISSLVIAALGSPLLAWVLHHRDRRYHFYRGWMGGGLFGAIGYATGGDWLAAAVSAANFILAAVLWWWSRRRRKRAPRAFSAEARALLAAVVRTMRERSRPRPVLRPVPGRAGA